MSWVVKMLSPMGLVYVVDNDAGHPSAATDRRTTRIDSLARARRLAKSVHGKVYRLVPRKSGPTGPRGPQGPTGMRGATGPTGEGGITRAELARVVRKAAERGDYVTMMALARELESTNA